LAGARTLLAKAERLDPLTPMTATAMGWLHWYEGDFDAALRSMSPMWNTIGDGNPWCVVQAYHQAAAGELANAARTIDGLQAVVPQHLLTRLGVFLLHAWRGENAEAMTAVTPDLEMAACWDDVWPLFLASGYAMIGEADRAFRWLDHAVGQGITNVAYLKERDPFLATLRQDPRFAGILEKARRSAEAVAAAAAAAVAGSP
jgi:hypothetical protein